MDFISLLITLVGLLLLVGIYAMSRYFYYTHSSSHAEQSLGKLPILVDRKGNPISSIMHDWPATDGSARQIIPSTEGDTTNRSFSSTGNTLSQNHTEKPSQLVLFLANPKGIDGTLILQTLKDNGFYLGEMDVFHFPSKTGRRDSLFRVANGVRPWKLRPQDIKGTTTPGLSLLMQIPTPINNQKAVKLFIDKSQKLAKALNATLKSELQTPFNGEDKKRMLNMVKN